MKKKSFDINEYIGAVGLGLMEYLRAKYGRPISDATMLKLVKLLDKSNFDYRRLPRMKTSRERDILNHIRAFAPDGRIGHNAVLYMLSDVQAEKYFSNHPLLRVQVDKDDMTIVHSYLPNSGACLWPGWGVEFIEAHDYGYGISRAKFVAERRAKLEAQKAQVRQGTAMHRTLRSS